MEVLNTTARPIFLGVKDRRLQDVEELRRGVNFLPGIPKKVPDELALAQDFINLRDAGDLVIVAYGDDPTSTVQQEELVEAIGDLLREVPLSVSFNGETVFALPSSYKPGGQARMLINTAWYDPPGFFTITGTQLIWLNVFILETSDDVLVSYEEDTP